MEGLTRWNNESCGACSFSARLIKLSTSSYLSFVKGTGTSCSDRQPHAAGPAEIVSALLRCAAELQRRRICQIDDLVKRFGKVPAHRTKYPTARHQQAALAAISGTRSPQAPAPFG